MGSPYDPTTPKAQRATTKGAPAPKLDKTAGRKAGMAAEPKWMPELRGPRRKVFKTFGRRVKTTTHEDY